MSRGRLRERLSFEVQEVRAARFVGVTVKPHHKEHRPAGQIVEVPFDELAVLEVTRFEAKSAALGLMLAACSYQPSMQHPKLPSLVPIGTKMACPQIDGAIDRADSVRWLIRDDGPQARRGLRT